MNIGELLVNVITVLLFYFFISRTFTLRRLHWICRGIGLMLLFVLITLLNLMNIAPTITCVSGLICQILYTMVFAEGSRGARLLIGGIPALLAVVSDSVTFSVLGILFQDTSEALTVNSSIRGQALVIYILTYCLLIWAVIQFFPQDLKFPGYFTCGLGVFASDILLKYVFYFERNEIVLSRISLATVNYIFLGVLLLLLMIVELLGIYYSKNNELQQRNNLYQIEEQELVNLKESSAFIRGWKHDYKNQLQVLSTMLQQKQYDESLLYVNELLSSSDMIKPVFSSGNPILDAVLSLKYYTMEHKGIRFEHSVYLPTAFPLSPLDTSTLFTNILDNAIEACQSCPAAPWIHLDIKPKGDMLLITLSNSSAANYRYNKKGNLLSTKDGKEHGCQGNGSLWGILSGNTFC